MIPKPVAFRPTETSEKLIHETMQEKHLDYESDAINYLIERPQAPQIPQQTPSSPVAPLSTPQVEVYHSDRLPASMERELQHFLNGRDSPLIAMLLSDIPRKKPSLYLATTALHDT